MNTTTSGKTFHKHPPPIYSELYNKVIFTLPGAFLLGDNREYFKRQPYIVSLHRFLFEMDFVNKPFRQKYNLGHKLQS